MASFFESFLKILEKILWSIFLYAFTSIFFMVLVISLVSGKFPPPVKEIWGNLKDAKQNITKITQISKQLSTLAAQGTEPISEPQSPKAKPVPHAPAEGNSASGFAELAKLDGLAKMKDHNRDLEQAFAAGGDGTTVEFTVNKGSGSAGTNQNAATQMPPDYQRMRFEIDVLKSQLAQARQDIETLKQSLSQPKNGLALKPSPVQNINHGPQPAAVSFQTKPSSTPANNYRK